MITNKKFPFLDMSKPATERFLDIIKTAKQELIKAAKAEVFGKTLDNIDRGIETADKIVDLINRSYETPAGKDFFGAISNGFKSLTNNSHQMLGYCVQNSQSTINQTKVYSIRLNLGKPSSYSIKQLALANGTADIQLSNSLSDAQSTSERTLLSRSFGFNQKSLDFLSPKFYVSVKDYMKIFNIQNWKLTEDTTQIPYGLALEEFSNVRIRNSNTYHKIKVKVNLIKIIDDDVTMSLLYRNCVNSDASVQESGTIPKVYQISDEIAVNDYINYVLCYEGVSLNQSSYFKTNAKIVKSFHSTLGPGDTLDFRMTYHCGSGIRIDLAKVFIKPPADGKQPSSYGIIVEAIGTLSEGVRLEDKAVFQGTSPGWYNYEYSTGIKVVKTSSIVSHPSESKSIIGRYAIKIVEKQFLTNPPITFNASEIGRPGQPDPTFAIISTSDEKVVYSSNITNTTNVENKTEKV